MNFFFFHDLGLQDYVVQQICLQISLFYANSLQSIPSLTFSMSSFTLSYQRSLGIGFPNGRFPCDTFSCTYQ